MTTLTEDNTEKENHLLSLRLDLLSLEMYEDSTEGWINYSLAFFDDEKGLFSTNATIHDSELRVLLDMMAKINLKPFTFEPMEPDFELSVIPEDDHGSHVLVTCFINDLAKRTGIYGESGIGVKFETSLTALKTS